MSGQVIPTAGAGTIEAGPSQRDGPASLHHHPVARHHLGHRRRSVLVVSVLAGAAAIGGGAAGCHPTGTPGVDQAYAAALAALVTVAASRASRSVLLLVVAVCAALARGWLLLPAVTALILAFGAVFPRRSYRRLSALIGALASQVILRWPPVGFQGFTALVAALITAVLLASLVGHLRARWRRRLCRAAIGVAGGLVLLSTPSALGLVHARAQLTRGTEAATQGLRSAMVGEDPVTASTSLWSSAGAFTSAGQSAGAWWSAGADLVPVLAQHRRSIADASRIAAALTAKAASARSQLDLTAVSRDGTVDLPAIGRAGSEVDQLSAALTSAQRQLGGPRSRWLLPGVADRLDHLRVDVGRAGRSAALAGQVLRALPPILGGAGDRRYLVTFLTPDESRGLDGFIGAYAEIDVHGGKLTMVRNGRATDLNGFPAGSRHITGAPEYLDRYGPFAPAGHFEDLTYSPDFPTDAQVISQLYPQSGGDHIDGVIAIDPYSLASLLRLTGPITVPGSATPLTASNAAGYLLTTQYAADDGTLAGTSARHDLLQAVLVRAFRRLATSTLPPPQLVARMLGPSVTEGRLLFWSDHPDEQPILRRLGLAGAFPSAGGGDLLSVVTQNATNNKADAYLTKSTAAAVTYDPATGQTTSAVTVTLHNGVPDGAAPDFLTSYAGSGLPPGTDRIWLTVYSPLQLRSATSGDAPLGFNDMPELGVDAYSAYVDVPRGASVTIALDLAGTLAAGPTYTMQLHQQPGATAQRTVVQVHPTSGWRTTADRSSPDAAERTWTSHFIRSS